MDMRGKRLSGAACRILAAMLSLCIYLGAIPYARAEDPETESSLHLEKSAVLEDDGSYTITMEAYATGTVTTETERVPTDIIIVMDVSGSMNDPDFSTDGTPSWQLYEGWGSTAIDLQENRNGTFYHIHENTAYAVELVNLRNYSGTFYQYNSGSYKNIGTLTNKDILGYRCSYDGCDVYYDGGYHYRYVAVADGVQTPFTNFEYYAVGDDVHLSDDNFALYRQTADITRIEAMRQAVNSFIATTAQQNTGVSQDKQHRIAIVKYSGQYFSNYEVGNHYHTSSPLYTNSDGAAAYRVSEEYGGSTTYNETTFYYTSNCAQILSESNYVTDSTASAMQTAVNNLIAGGPTQAAYGIGLAYKVAQENLAQDPTRKQVVLFFTDGEPTGGLSFDSEIANETISSANTLKTECDASIYAISLMPDASVSATMGKYINYVSSNYPNAQSLTSSGTQVSSKYYKQIHTMADLNEIFDDISKETHGTSTDLDALAQLRDYMADGFVFTDNTRVTVETANYLGNNTWADPVKNTDVTVEVDSTNNAVSVTGFSYKDNYVIDGSGTVATQGKKLIVTITGVEATDAAIQNQLIPTNLNTSGIYPSADSDTPAGLFPVPEVQLTSKFYVLDYARPADLHAAEWQQSRILHLDPSGMHYFTTPALLRDMPYGLAQVSDDNRAVLTYTPQTMRWDSYDDLYILGKDSSDSNTNIWSKISVLPANNVYYEDDFVATDADESNQAEIPDARIVYTNHTKPEDMSQEDWDALQGSWPTAGEPGDNREDPNGAVHGWISDLADDAGHTNGVAHLVASITGQGSANLPTASFTFTGTGVDIYSYTDSTTGTILVSVKDTASGGKTWYYVVDNLSASGSYYQVPTVTFSGNHSTYDVKITVTTGGSKEGRFTYYLDGIRVYKPLGDQTDDTIEGAYGNEISAIFTELRNTLTGGTVFIDEDAEGNAICADYETYGDYAKFAPQHEIYLAKGESVSFRVSGSADCCYYLGMKTLSGSPVTAEYSYGNGEKMSKVISHTADLYYEIMPINGIITVSNNTDCDCGEGTCRCILSITKLRQTGAETSQIMTLSEEDALVSYRLFRSLSPIPEETAPPTEPEETTPPTEPEETTPPTEPEETTPPTEPEETTPPTEPDGPQIEITNPEQTPEAPVTQELLWRLIKLMIMLLRDWFIQ